MTYRINLIDTLSNMDLPKISCVTTLYNERELVVDCIESVLSQTYENLELIVVDDGSADDTASFVDRFNDPRIVRIRQSNDGLSSARNRGLAHVTGDYVCFLDADDTRPAWAFSSIAAAVARSAPDVLFCRGLLSDIRGELGDFYDQRFFDRWRADWAESRLDGALSNTELDDLFSLAHLLEPQSANKVVRVDFLRENGLHFPNTHFFEDMFFHTACLATAERIDFLDEVCFTYFRRYAKKQITSGTSDMRLDSVAVARLTLDLFARSVHFSSPIRRAAVLASVMRIVSWCEETIAHNFRYYFSHLLSGALSTVDEAYRSIPGQLPDYFDQVRQHLDYACRHFQDLTQ